MRQSRKLTLTDWTTANNALIRYFQGNKSKLAGHVSMSRTTVTDFFSEKPIGESSFHKICLTLRLNWQQVSAAVPAETGVNDPRDIQEARKYLQQIEIFVFWHMLELYIQKLKLDILKIETAIETIRERCRQKILAQHSRMRLLSGKELGVDQLYGDLWLVEKPEY